MSTKANQLSVIPGGKPEIVSDDLVGAVQRYVDAVVAPLREKITVQQAEIDALKVRPQPQIRGVIDRNGDLVLTYGDGTVCNVGRVVGRDGKDGDPGLGFDDLDLVRVDESERKFVLRMTRGDKVKEFALLFAVPLYRGVWKEGMQLYRGDMVSRGGSIWLCTTPVTTSAPGENNPDVVLACKRGRDARDGKSAYDIARENGFQGSEKEWLRSLVGPPGPPGRTKGVLIAGHAE